MEIASITKEMDAVQKWKLAHYGNFSASEIWKLDQPGKVMDKISGSRELFGEAAWTYIKKIARQQNSLFNERDFMETYDMKMGKILEPQAYQAIHRALGSPEWLYYFGDANPEFVKHPEIPNFGASADCRAILPTGETSFGAEFKCPKPDTHFEYILTLHNANDLFKHQKDYWWQCQGNMMVHKCDHWIFASYDEFSHVPVITIEVEADPAMQQRMSVLLRQANIEVGKLLDQAKKRK